MEALILYSVLAAVILLLCFFAVKIALRWIVRLAVIVLVVLLALGGAAWWWFNQPTKQPVAQPRPSTTRRASSDRR